MQNFFKYFFFLLFFYQCLYSQELTNDKDALALCKEAKQNMLNLETKQSIIQCEKVLDYAIKNKNNFLAAKVYNLIGLNFEEFADTKRAVSYYNKAINLALIVKNDTLTAAIYNNLGGIYLFNDIDIDKGLKFYNKSLHHAEIAKLKEDYVQTKMNVATSLINLKRYEEGFVTLKELEKGILNSKDPESNLYLSTLYATYYNEYKNNFKLADYHYNQALLFTNKIELGVVKLNVVNLYDEMSKFYIKFNDVNKGFKYLKLHDDLEDEIYDSNKNELLKEQELSIKLSEVNNHIRVVEIENKENIQKLKNNTLFIWILLGLIILFLYMLYTVFRNNKKNKLISKKLKIANIDLYEARKKSEETSQLKSQFISTVSHELRTPLYGVIGMTEIIENEFKELKDNNYFKTLKFSSKHLLNLINDVLYMYKIQEGTIDLVSDKINLKNEIEVIKNLLDVIAKQNNNTIEVQISQDIPENIETDKTRLAQVIINLLSNAIKFTKNGKIIVKIDKISNEKPMLNFQIIDTGIGIPKEHLDKVFDKFVQLDRNVDENFQGTGLGLSIVEKIITLFGGIIKIESEENQGTKVSFTIPLKEVVFKQNNIKNSDTILNRQIYILVVDDNKINQMVSRKMLINNNQKCKMVSSGFDAIEVLQKENFDLILMDIHMPIMNGFETSKKIRELNIITPIIALTASDKNEISENIDMKYLNGILVKPFEYIELQILINEFV